MNLASEGRLEYVMMLRTAPQFFGY